MASLRDAVKTYQDELRNGIAWVVFWRDGRSWDSDYTYIELGSETIGYDDISRLEHISRTDPRAVALNGYYCGHLGEDMTLDELTSGVRWHYENGFNTLAAFIENHDGRLPPELIEETRQIAHAAGLPFSERPYDGQELDPYVYDGSMTPEDYELWQQLIAQERSAEMNDPLSIQIHNRQRFEQGDPGEWLKLPATAEQLQAAMRRVGITAENPQDFFINGIDSPIEAVARLSLENIQAAGVDELNYLAAAIQSRDDKQIEKLNAAVEMIADRDDIHRLVELTQNTGVYDFHSDIFNHIQLGEYTLEHSGLIQIPDEWAAAIDIEMLGQLAAEHEKGVFTEYGYIVPNGEAWKPVKDIPQEYRIMSYPQLEPGRDEPPVDYDAISTRAPAVATAKPPELSPEQKQPQPVMPIVLTAENPRDKLKEITDKLEQGIAGIFESEQYSDYLKTLSKFHNYSLNNTILITMQKPDASHVAGFNTWKNEFERNVRKGEKGIKILAPSPFKVKKEMEKIDPQTQRPIIGRDGKPVTEEVEITIPAFKVVSVFDVSQTEGKELPTIGVDELTGSVDRYKDFFAALEKTSSFPIAFENIESGAKGYANYEEKRIAINEGMSELQTLKTAIHEISHARLHDTLNNEQDEQPRVDRRTREVQAESIAYTVCQHYGLDTSDYSFGYVAGWSSDKELAELKASLETIRTAAAELITEIDGHFAELQKSQEIEQTPVFDKLSPEQQQALSNEVQVTLQFFINSDMQTHGEVTESTLEAIAVQGYEYRDGILAKAAVPEQQPGMEEWSEPATAENAPKNPSIPSDDIGAYLPEQAAPEQERQQGDTYAIYQLKQDDSTRDFRFEPYDRLQAAGLTVDPTNYVFVYSGQLGKDETLDTIFERFNISRPADFTGHSLSVSDVVSLNRGGVETAHYVDSGAGYKEVPEFLQPAPAFDMQQTATEPPAPDNFLTGEKIKTPRGSFSLTDMTPAQMETAGYGFHHSSDDGRYHIMGNGTRAFAIINPLRTAEMSTEQNYNMIDGIPNNRPTVDELEARAKAGQQISLTDLAAAIKADKAAAAHDTGKKPSIREQLKQTGADPSHRDKSAPSRTRDKSPGLEV